MGRAKLNVHVYMGQLVLGVTVIVSHVLRTELEIWDKGGIMGTDIFSISYPVIQLEIATNVQLVAFNSNWDKKGLMFL